MLKSGLRFLRLPLPTFLRRRVRVRICNNCDCISVHIDRLCIPHTQRVVRYTVCHGGFIAMVSTARRTVYPRGCTFTETDWDALAPFWYPIAFSRDVKDQPISATLLDQRLVIWRTSAGISVANDICLHRGIPLSMGWVKDD